MSDAKKELTRCPECDKPMMEILSGEGVQPDFQSVGFIVYECPNCGEQHTEI